MIMWDGKGFGLLMTEANKSFLQVSGFSLIYINVYNFEDNGFFKQLLVQNELIF